MQITVVQTPIKDLLVLEAKIFSDDRGFFMETYSKRDFHAVGVNDEFVQENYSRSGKNILRGLHFQDLKAPMAKLVRCTRGSVYDVAVDIRAGSETFGKWLGVELSEENKKMFYIPVGFAHGFQTLTDVTDVQYRQTNYYMPEAEKNIAWNDPSLNISWPMQDPTLSEKDKNGVSFEEYKSSPTFT